MFPLGMVLLPGGILPLHVFEPRYRQMIINCLQEDGHPEFGQALITHGADAGGGDERAMVGTIAQMVQVEALDGERYALIAIGTRRIRINTWLPDAPYPIADVDDWPDEEPDAGLSIAVAATHARVQAVLKMAVELGDVSAETVESEISDDPLFATYHLASLAPIGPADRYRLLVAPSPAARLNILDDVLDDVEAMLKFRLI
jgi:Lon protease-like protein